MSDSQDLLKRYMQMIVHEEGMSFVGSARPDKFSAEEIALLNDMAREINAPDAHWPTTQGDGR